MSSLSSWVVHDRATDGGPVKELPILHSDIFKYSRGHHVDIHNCRGAMVLQKSWHLLVHTFLCVLKSSLFLTGQKSLPALLAAEAQRWIQCVSVALIITARVCLLFNFIGNINTLLIIIENTINQFSFATLVRNPQSKSLPTCGSQGNTKLERQTNRSPSRTFADKPSFLGFSGSPQIV